MNMQNQLISINIPNTPQINGLVWRGFRGAEDYPHMVAIVEASKVADGLEWVTSVEQVAQDYEFLENCDPYTDMVFAEIDGEVVGYGRCWWEELLDNTRIYGFFAHLRPEWRESGVRQAMAHRLEERLRAIAGSHPNDGEKQFQCWVSHGETDWEKLLQEMGYTAVRYGYEMVRPNLEDITELPLPDGLELRPADLSQWRQIWEAVVEAFRDHWGARVPSENNFAEWQAQPTFNPALWQVAWDGDEVAGGVLTYIDHEENAAYGRLRGYTETIFTRRPWRRRGLAHALIARSLHVQKEQGMTESALGVDAENLSGALNIYKSMGFQVTKRAAAYWKQVG